MFHRGARQRLNDTEPVAEEEDVIPTATPLPALSPPDNIAFAPGGTTVTWDAVTDAVTDAAGYIIEWFKGDDSPSSHEVTGTSCNIPNFDTTESYAVTVKTVNRANVAGPASDNVVWTPPGAPKNLRINNDGSVTSAPSRKPTSTRWAGTSRAARSPRPRPLPFSHPPTCRTYRLFSPNTIFRISTRDLTAAPTCGQ